MTVDVVLVNPPFFDLHRPSIALGILKAVLTAGGLRTRVLYGNLAYAERIGLSEYEDINVLKPEYAVGEWVFSSAAFPELQDDNEGYIRLIESLDLASSRRNRDGIQVSVDSSLLLERRRQAEECVSALAAEIAEINPKIVGCTSTFCQHSAALAILRRVRERCPSITTLLGGANCEGEMGWATHRNFKWVDYVVSGEADDVIVPLCRMLLRNTGAIKLEELPVGVFGPAHRTEAGVFARDTARPARAVAHDINASPTPDYDEYFEAVSRSQMAVCIEATLPLESARGCWWGQLSHCTFCGLNGNGMAFRSKKAEVVLRDMHTLSSKYGLCKIEMVDNILDLQYFKSLLPTLEASADRYSIFYEVKSNLNKEHVAQLRRAGVRAIQPGIESFDTRILKLMRKGVASWQNVRLLKWARQYGISAQWNTIFGVPGEKDAWYAELNELLPALFHLQPGGCNALRFDRFSPYHTHASEYGLDLIPFPTYQYVFPLPAEELAKQTYFFARRDSEANWFARYLQYSPEARRYVSICRQWYEAWSRRPRPVCALFERAGQNFISDTRPQHFTGTRSIGPLTEQILETADDGIVSDELSDAVGSKYGWSESIIKTEIARLVSSRLLLLIDGRALSLVLHAPVMRIVVRDLPFGHAVVKRKVMPSEFSEAL